MFTVTPIWEQQNSFELAWSPDGTLLAINADIVGNAIYLVNADGSELRRLLSRTVETEITQDTPEGPVAERITILLPTEGLVWSPDGTRLLFHGAVWNEEAER